MGHVFAPRNVTFENLTPLLRKRVQLPEDAELDIYEEIKYEPSVMCQQQRMQDTLNNAQLEHGDILCIQKTLQPVSILIVPMAESGDIAEISSDKSHVFMRFLEAHAEPP